MPVYRERRVDPAHDAGRYSDRGCARGNILDHDRIGADAPAVVDGDRAEHLGAGTDSSRVRCRSLIFTAPQADGDPRHDHDSGVDLDEPVDHDLTVTEIHARMHQTVRPMHTWAVIIASR